MSSEPESQSNVEMIHQSLKEVHQSLSVLEEQIKLGLFTAQPDNETVEIVTPEEQPFVLEDDSFLTSWF